MDIQLGDISFSSGVFYSCRNILHYANGHLHGWYSFTKSKERQINFLLLLDPTSILNYVVFYFVLALPMVYMQIIVGQYSQLGVVFFKHLTPIGHGIGFVLCINTFWSCILKSVVMADVSLYLLSSLKAELPWMKCPPNNKNCWVVNGACTRNCFTPDKNLSAFVFWQYLIQQDLN